jgi:murein DD-endopeptidase MepM/ murein hydrolase activator NlpD
MYHNGIGFSLVLLLVLVACQPIALTPTSDAMPTEDAKSTIEARIEQFTPIPTAEIALTPTPTIPPTATPSLTPTFTATLAASATWTPQPTVAPTVELVMPTVPPTATIGVPVTLRRVDHYRLRRPIERSDALVDYGDKTYPYGGTQFGAREVHLGLDFFNVRFTPILAAADGTVIFADMDINTLIGSAADYYGKAVIIQHNFNSPEGLPVFTLYGHVQDILVSAGQSVREGEIIATVGDAGVAIGPHLHFEVRVGDAFDYRTTRNPDLWIRPYPGFGTLAGRVASASGIDITGLTILVRDPQRTRETYTYGGDRVNSNPAWEENFTLADLPAGTYEVFVSTNGRSLFRETIAIRDGDTTWIAIAID